MGAIGAVFLSSLEGYYPVMVSGILMADRLP
jgi:hypothetical protein